MSEPSDPAPPEVVPQRQAFSPPPSPLIAAFLVVGGTYGTVVQIKASYDAGQLSKVFGCADNSNTVGV